MNIKCISKYGSKLCWVPKLSVHPFRIDIVMTKVLNDFDILHLRFQRPIHNIVHNVKSLKAH